MSIAFRNSLVSGLKVKKNIAILVPIYLVFIQTYGLGRKLTQLRPVTEYVRWPDEGLDILRSRG